MLDHEPVGEGLCPIPTGRAYMGSAGVYGDKIHVMPFGERFRDGVEPRGGLYMGTAGLMNLAHIARIKPSHAILFDVNPFQTIFSNVVISAAKYNPNYEDFRRTLNYGEILTRRIMNRRLEGVRFSSIGSRTEIFDGGDKKTLSRKTFPSAAVSFSSHLDVMGFRREDYDYIHEMASKGRMSTLTLDVFDVAAWRQLEAFLRVATGLPNKASVLYVSSIFSFVNADSDWTGRKLKEISLVGLSNILDTKSSIVIDHQREYTAGQYYRFLEEGKPWLSLNRGTKESVQVSGADRLGQLSI